MRKVYLVGFLALASMAACLCCSKEQAPQPTRPVGSSAQPATQPSSQPAAPPPLAAAPASASTGKTPGAPATEKHTLVLTNYAKVAVTVTINGAWVGQWDNSVNAPLDSVIQGMNQLVVELADQPKNVVQLEIYAERAGQNVNLVRLNFQDKPKGSYPSSFAAR